MVSDLRRRRLHAIAAILLAVLASLWGAHRALAPSADIGALLWLTAGVLSGPFCTPLTMAFTSSASLESVGLALVVGVVTMLPIVIGARRKRPPMLGIGAALWVLTGWFWAIGIYI